MRITNPPQAKDLMATARSFGNYDLSAALADLIDNSIKAKSTRVDITFEPKDSDVVVRIRDDGTGMPLETLIIAMRPASANPQDSREPDDLGRFGWGLKSASLSQARVLTVVSWCKGIINAARWDLDNIDDWGMEVLEGPEAQGLLSNSKKTESGTEIIWTHSDRVLERDVSPSFDDSLTFSIAYASQRLSLIFHRYLAGETERRLAISVNGRLLCPIDPFMTAHNATQTLDAEVIKTTNGSLVSIQPYVLPHFSKLTMEEQERIGGPEGMVRNQGFYVYRNKRLIIFGTWFRLVPHGELSQLTRVRVDLPNTVDAEWRITLDKSDAQLPAALKRRLQEIVRRFNRRSFSVHRNKGVLLGIPKIQSVWLRYVKNGQIRYQVNRNHPMVASLITMDSESGNAESVLRLLESYFPTDKFIADVSDGGVNQSPTTTEEFESLVHQCVLNFIQGSRELEVEAFLAFIRDVEPFSSQWTYTESYVRNNTAKKWGMKNGL
ncbi:ATP-binding protein [Pseudomonas fluorescens]|uniref:ATP-binding protein n=1 Tax=Pseudomonas fluorescens TaxID=294 RepID=UPI00209B7B09|nr:ATP-binding protein [Pseudomonas fluorescens]MCO7627106.1 ATP-binding protein [Pseudomonas fluorescens]